jgi:hypothetical protein
MDIFKYNTITSPTSLDQAEFLNNLKSVMWVERYKEPGEFSIEADLSSGIMGQLPLGTLISHTNTLEVMIVENHEIKEKKSEDPTIVVSGRTFFSFLENRIVGTDSVRASTTISPYILVAQQIQWQIRDLIKDHIGSLAATANDRLDDVDTIVEFYTAFFSGDSVARTIKPGTVMNAVIDLLNVYDMGIKTIRKNPFGDGTWIMTYLLIYKGAPRQNTVMFSWKDGDLDSADHLISQKKKKNSAIIMGTYTNHVVDLGPTKYDRRFMIVDAKDIDGHLDKTDSFSGLTASFQRRGREALAKQTNVVINRADVSSTAKYLYRRDYYVGDLVSVDSNYGDIAVMRVVEYAEIQDENGESGHPTLAFPEVP